MTQEQLLLINGGAISGTIINAFVRFVNVFYEVGQALGSSIRRIRTRNYC